MINWSHYPKSTPPSELCQHVVQVFESVEPSIGSPKNKLESDEVLAKLTRGLQKIGFRVETGKTKAEKIYVPVFYGLNGKVEKSFDADAYHEEKGCVLEVEAGRAVINFQFLKDLFQACMMSGVTRLYVAVRNLYEGGGRKSKDFEKVVTFFDTLYASDRLVLPLKEILVIGY